MRGPKPWRATVLEIGESCPTFRMTATSTGVRACLRYLQEVCGYEVQLLQTRLTEPAVKLKPRRLRMGKITRVIEGRYTFARPACPPKKAA